MTREYKRFLIISDIHSNRRALEAVVNDIRGPIDRIYCAGDIIGYGPNPNEVIDILRERDTVCVLGNHDHYLLNGIAFSKSDAHDALQLNDAMLNREQREYLARFSTSPIINDKDKIAMVHGSFAAAPHFFHRQYTHAEEDKKKSLEKLFDESYKNILVGIIGHTHQQSISATRYGTKYRVPIKMKVKEGARTITVRIFCNKPERPYPVHLRIQLNPGSVGQPRTGSPKANYALLAMSKKYVLIHFKSVSYNLESTQQDMKDKGFPQNLIDRLGKGW